MAKNELRDLACSQILKSFLNAPEVQVICKRGNSYQIVKNGIKLNVSLKADRTIIVEDTLNKINEYYTFNSKADTNVFHYNRFQIVSDNLIDAVHLSFDCPEGLIVYSKETAKLDTSAKKSWPSKIMFFMDTILNDSLFETMAGLMNVDDLKIITYNRKPAKRVILNIFQTIQNRDEDDERSR